MKKTARRIVMLCTVCAVCAAASLPARAIKFDFVTVSDVVKDVKKRYGDIECFSADFRISTDKGGKKSIQQGSVKSKYPNKLLVEFTVPAGQKIVATDKMMYMYMPSLNVVAEQEINNEDSSIFSAGSKTGLRRLFNKYHYKFDSKDQPSAGTDGKKYYTLYLKQKESRSGYRVLRLWITEDFLIKRASGETSSGKKVDIEFSNIKTNENFSNGLFKFDPPSQARVIRNPMIAEE
ncbi:MAG: LolA family protein [Spirochaetota bacterium]